MALQYSDPLRNAQVDQLKALVSTGAGALLKIWSGSAPAGPATTDGGGAMLCSIALPNPFMQAASAGTALMNTGPWNGTGTAAAAGGTTATHFRIYSPAGGTFAIIQGNVTTDLILNNTSIANGQSVQVTQFTISAQNQ